MGSQDDVVPTPDPDPAPPAGAERPPLRRPPPTSWKVIAQRVFKLTVASALVLSAAAFIPTPYFLKAPGRADELSRMIHVSQGRRDFPGEFLMTTVIYERANLFFCLYAAIDGHAELDVQEQAHLRRPHFVNLPIWHMSQMDASKLSAKLAAMTYLRIPVTLKSDGVRILAFLNQAPASQVLQAGDVIDEVDHKPVRSYIDLHSALKPHKAGDQVHLEVERAGTTLDRDVPLISEQGKTIIGVQVENAFDAGELPRQIEINSRSIQGGSAGLMFALEIIRQMRGVDLTHGLRIAGTGTIEPNGTVGPVEGVPEKLVAAQRAGASVFLVPQENLQDLPSDHLGMQIIPVKTLSDAMTALSKLGSK